MNTKLTIKNFRVFDENGVSFELKPITILTGCNSSGKSSMTKAALLLNSFISQIKRDRDNKEKIKIGEYKLDFRNYPYNLLGRFDKVVHNQSSSKEITFEYETYSYMLSKNVTVSLVFGADENDKLNDGYLNSITMSTEDGVFFRSDRANGNKFNLNLIKEAGVNFMATENLVHYYCGLCSTEDGLNEVPFTGEMKNEKEHLKDCLLSDDDKRTRDIIKYVRIAPNNDSIVKRHKVDMKIVSKSLENGSLFYIPIIEELNQIDKANIKSWVNDELLKNESDGFVAYSNNIIDFFLSSHYSKFGEYFEDLECSYLKDYQLWKPFSLKESNFLSHLQRSRPYFDFDETPNKAEIGFNLLYDIVMKWNCKKYDSKTEYYDCDEFWKYSGVLDRMTDHYMMNDLMPTFATDLILEVLIPKWCGNVEYVSSSRVDVRRLYSLDYKNDFTELLKKYFDSRRKFANENKTNQNKEYEPDMFLNKWVDKFGIGKKISLAVDEEGLGVQIRIHKRNDEIGRLLADEGYGITQLVSLLLQIETSILSSKKEKINNYIGLEDLDGYDTDKYHYEQQTIIVEEPEIHLHPKYQSLLADMMLDAYQNYNIHFIVETHSEYLIRKSQVLVSKMEFKSNEESDSESPFRTYYVPQNGKPYSLGYRKDGKFAESFGSGFYDESTNLAFEIM